MPPPARPLQRTLDAVEQLTGTNLPAEAHTIRDAAEREAAELGISLAERLAQRLAFSILDSVGQLRVLGAALERLAATARQVGDTEALANITDMQREIAATAEAALMLADDE